MRVSDIQVDGPLRVLLEWMEQRRMEAEQRRQELLTELRLRALKRSYMLVRQLTARVRDNLWKYPPGDPRPLIHKHNLPAACQYNFHPLLEQLPGTMWLTAPGY